MGETQEEVDCYWERFISDGGTPACGWLTDKFGVPWQINPTILMELLSDSDPTKVQKAMGAMMQMVKIDAEALKRAMAEYVRLDTFQRGRVGRATQGAKPTAATRVAPAMVDFAALYPLYLAVFGTS